MLSILIVNWNTCEYLKRCLRSIAEHPPNAPLQVVVVDNASKDGSAEMVRAEFPWVELEASDKNLGYAAGNNIAFVMAKGEWQLTLNADTEFFDDSLQTAVDFMKGRKGAGVLAGKLLEPNQKTVQHSMRRFPTPGAILPEMFGLAKVLPRQFGGYRQLDFDYSLEGEAEQPMGSFLLFRKSALNDVGLMDERFPIFFNDVDILFRLKSAGWTIWYSPEVQLIHHGGASTKQIPKSMIWESHRSLIRYYWKWYQTWWSTPLLVLFSGIVWLGALVRARGWNAGYRP
ncbi:MAG: glycosyltransferase family 2 protein [Fimbriimonadales bacterium]